VQVRTTSSQEVVNPAMPVSTATSGTISTSVKGAGHVWVFLFQYDYMNYDVLSRGKYTLGMTCFRQGFDDKGTASTSLGG